MTTANRVFDPAVVRELQAQLLAERERLLRTVATTDDELATLEAHQPGAPVEDAASEEVRWLLSRLGERQKHELEEIYAAYVRLGAGAYGVCEGCGGEMPLVRLRAMPTARYCTACQVRREKTGAPS